MAASGRAERRRDADCAHYLANSRRVAYLDDDNWCADNHLQSLLAASRNGDWAYSLRWFVERDTGTPLGIDQWESVGPEAGVYAERFGGWVDPNCIMIDKVTCEPALRLWCFPLPGDSSRMSEDRVFFDHLRRHYPSSGSRLATTYYVMNPRDAQHDNRMRWLSNSNSRRGGPDPVVL